MFLKLIYNCDIRFSYLIKKVIKNIFINILTYKKKTNFETKMIL